MTMIDIKDMTLRLKKLRERKGHLEELIKTTEDQIHGIEQEMMRCGTNLPSSVVKCCGMCEPNCQVHYNDGCGCHKQCLDEDKPSKPQEKSLVEKIDDKLDEPLKEFVPERDWPLKL